jgi:hypothetical protein
MLTAIVRGAGRKGSDMSDTLQELRDAITDISVKFHNRDSSPELLERYITAMEKLFEIYATKREQDHVGVYRWLLGYEDFPESLPGKRYGWRTELRKRMPEGTLDALEASLIDGEKI